MARRGRPEYPTLVFPLDPAEQKLLGLYPQRQGGQVLQRVRIPAGRLRSTQLAAMASAAAALGARDALHVTTRQDIEIHGLAPESVPALHRLLAAAELTTVGSAGDTVRNSTVDPLGGLVPGNRDMLPLATAIEEALQRLDGIWTLPRKFKLSFSGDDRALMKPWMSDVGVVASADGSFAAVVAGSLGAKPATGMPFRVGMSAEDIGALAVAAVRLHERAGDRENRTRARLRHVREELGDEAFREALGELWEEERMHSRVGPFVQASAPREDRAPEHLRLAVPHGDIPLDVARDLADVASGTGVELRIGIEHDLHIFGLQADQLPAGARSWLSPRRIVACPGTALCTKAAGPTHEAAALLQPVAEAHPELLFSLSGCPNSCSHAAIASIGVVARMKRIGDQRLPVFRVAIDGDAGTGPALATVAAVDVPLEDLAATVESLLSSSAPESADHDRD